MMVEAQIGNAIAKAEKYLQTIPNGATVAVSRAMNRAITQGRALSARAIAKEYTVKTTRVKAAITIQKATRDNLTATLNAKGARLSLSNFKFAPQSDTTGGNRKPVRVAVKKGALKPLGRSFVYNGRIFSRLGTASKPVEMLHGSSIPGMLGNVAVSDEIYQEMANTFEKRVDHEINRIMDKGVEKYQRKSGGK